MLEPEFLLTSNPARFVIFPIQHPDIWEMNKKAIASLWTVEVIDQCHDHRDWDGKLTENERFFAVSYSHLRAHVTVLESVFCISFV